MWLYLWNFVGNSINKGPDNKPLYVLISEEDPEHPIIRDSSTGCWVYVC